VSAKFWRVKATLTVTGEWFVPIEEFALSAEDAMEFIRSAAGTVDPENILEDHQAYILPSEVWLADENGERWEPKPTDSRTGDRESPLPPVQG